MKNYSITIEIVKGGFLLSYPAPDPSANELSKFGITSSQDFIFAREVFTSQRKMNQKIKEVLNMISTTPDDSKAE